MSDEDQRQAEIEFAWAQHEARRQANLNARAQLARKFDDQDGACFYCGRECWLWPKAKSFRDPALIEHFEEMRANRRRQKTRATREHLIRVADGGTDDDANIVMACAVCNHSRQDMPVDLWKRVRQEQALREDA